MNIKLKSSSIVVPRNLVVCIRYVGQWLVIILIVSEQLPHIYHCRTSLGSPGEHLHDKTTMAGYVSSFTDFQVRTYTYPCLLEMLLNSYKHSIPYKGPYAIIVRITIGLVVSALSLSGHAKEMLIFSLFRIQDNASGGCVLTELEDSN